MMSWLIKNNFARAVSLRLKNINTENRESRKCIGEKMLRITLLPGDGIGPEVVSSAVKVLKLSVKDSIPNLNSRIA